MLPIASGSPGRADVNDSTRFDLVVLWTQVVPEQASADVPGTGCRAQSVPALRGRPDTGCSGDVVRFSNN